MWGEKIGEKRVELVKRTQMSSLYWWTRYGCAFKSYFQHYLGKLELTVEPYKRVPYKNPKLTMICLYHTICQLRPSIHILCDSRTHIRASLTSEISLCVIIPIDVFQNILRELMVGCEMKVSVVEIGAGL